MQGELETALVTILREPVELTVAGRTDAGVHARGPGGELLDRRRPSGDLTRRFNGLSPADIAVPATAVVDNGFDARRDATLAHLPLPAPRPPALRAPSSRSRALWWPHRIDHAALDACAAALPGTHDFTAFTPTQTDHVRFDRNVFDGQVGPGWRRSSTSDHRRHLHAQHGPHPRRHDARGRQRPPDRRGLPPAPRRRPPRSQPAKQLPRTAYTWSQSPTPDPPPPSRCAVHTGEALDAAAAGGDLEHRADQDPDHVAHEGVGGDAEGEDVAGLLAPRPRRGPRARNGRGRSGSG